MLIATGNRVCFFCVCVFVCLFVCFTGHDCIQTCSTSRYFLPFVNRKEFTSNPLCVSHLCHATCTSPYSFPPFVADLLIFSGQYCLHLVLPAS